MHNESELNIVTEVGTFGNLNIEDPTVKKINKEEDSLEALIESSIQDNANNLVGICE